MTRPLLMTTLAALLVAAVGCSRTQRSTVPATNATATATAARAPEPMPSDYRQPGSRMTDEDRRMGTDPSRDETAPGSGPPPRQPGPDREAPGAPPAGGPTDMRPTGSPIPDDVEPNRSRATRPN